MGRRKYEVNDETAYRWCERYRRGDSFRKIALDEKVERRHVARVVRDFNRLNHLGEGIAARRQTRANFLQEHLEDLKMVATILLELTATPSVKGQLGSCGSNIEPDLVDAVAEGISWRIKPTTDRSMAEVAFWGRWEQHIKSMVKRLAKDLISDLEEHLPGLSKKVKVWGQAAVGYKATWEELSRQAESKGITPELFESGLREGLASMPSFQKEDNLPPVPVNPESAAEMALWLFKNPETRELLEPFDNNLKALERAYGELLNMLNPFQLRKALLERECKDCPLPQG